MSDAFLISGLPRSRTAWMAAAAMSDQVICFHEPTAWLDRADDVFETIWGGRLGRAYVGISDHALGFHLPEIMRRLAPRTLIIERPIAAVKASAARLGIPDSNFCELLSESLAYSHPQIRRIRYDALASTPAVLSALRWLTPRAPLDPMRIEELQRLNIQADIRQSLETARQRAPELDKFIPPAVLTRLRPA